VTSGRSVAMSSLALGQLSACAGPVPKRKMDANPDRTLQPSWRTLIFSGNENEVVKLVVEGIPWFAG
jgi:hypothetical protein